MGNSGCQSCGVADCDKTPSKSGAPCRPAPTQSFQGLSPQHLTGWDFNALNFEASALQSIAHQLLAPSYSQSGGQKAEVLRSFVKSLSATYRPVAFHNFAHAVDVLQCLCWQCEHLPTMLSPSQRLALGTAALGVDVGHPGFDNAFLIDVGDQIASCYNDFSPLENMHCSKLFDVLKKDGHNVLGHMPAEEFREARRLVIDAILHTDKYCHKDVLNDVRALARQGYTPKSVDFTTEEGAEILQALSRALLVLADLSHQARPLDTANAWAAVLQTELSSQDEREREMGLQVLPLNRWKPSRSDLQLHLAMSRSGPLLGALLHIFPALEPASTRLAENAKSWAEDIAAQDEVEGQPQVDARPKKIETMLDPTRPPAAPVLETSKGHDRFGYLGAARPYSGRQERLTTSTLASTLSTNSPPGSNMGSEPPANAKSPPLIREVRRWKESRTNGSKEFSQSIRGRELVLLYVLSDPAAGAPVTYRFVDRNSANLEELAAADEAVAKGSRAASEDVVVDRRRRCSRYDGGSTPVLQSQKSADAVSTMVESNRFDDIMSALLHGNVVMPSPEQNSNSSPSIHHRASRTSAVVSEISAVTRDRAAMAASVFSVLLKGDAR
ncbi:unnamed protein product [Effrenium voratum]|uniref:PDEase domain-containing protein n=1 Tax=Effrenium voratum TaxID=2562239 RepID=A0AA36I779_9DINO|nr:unnamed protein product [Effrenium voratum]